MNLKTSSITHPAHSHQILPTPNLSQGLFQRKSAVDSTQNLASLPMSAMSLIGSPVITGLVGPLEVNVDSDKLYIHKDKVVARSRFFASALIGRWPNTESNTVDIHKFDPGVLPEDMAHYLETVYTNHPSKYSLEHICHVYTIAEALLDLRTCNQCVLTVCLRLEGEGDVTEYNFWYDSAKPEWYVGGMEEAPKDFLLGSAQIDTSLMHEKDLGNLEKFLEGETEGGETGAGEEES
jgi:hypothetical protein